MVVSAPNLCFERDFCYAAAPQKLLKQPLAAKCQNKNLLPNCTHCENLKK